MLLFCLLTAAAVQDLRHGRISNRLIVTGLIAGALAQVIRHPALGIYIFLGNISIPVILFYLLFQMRVLGAGDIKLFSMIGGIVTTQELFRCMAYSFVAAGAGAVLFLAFDSDRRAKLLRAARYLLELPVTGRIVPYEHFCGKDSFSFAFAVPILFGTAAALAGIGG